MRNIMPRMTKYNNQTSAGHKWRSKAPHSAGRLIAANHRNYAAVIWEYGLTCQVLAYIFRKLSDFR
jgi:hypothetical protein